MLYEGNCSLPHCGIDSVYDGPSLRYVCPFISVLLPEILLLLPATLCQSLACFSLYLFSDYSLLNLPHFAFICVPEKWGIECSHQACKHANRDSGLNTSNMKSPLKGIFASHHTREQIQEINKILKLHRNTISII